MPDLGAKVDELRRVTHGNTRIKVHKDSAIATALRLDATAWSRIQNGERPVHEHHIEKLFWIFQLDYLPRDTILLDCSELGAAVQNYLQGIPSKADLAAYKRSIVDRFRHRSMPNRTMDVAEQYYPLRLVQHIHDARSRRGIDALEVLKDQSLNRVCILAPSGFGKTACIRRLLWESQHDDSIPFVLRLKTYVNLIRETRRIDIDALLEHSIGGLASEGSREKLVNLMKRRMGTFILDGLDYISEDSFLSAMLLDSVEDFFAGYPRARVIMTSRSGTDLLGHFDGFQFFNIEPVYEEDIATFLQAIGIPPESKVANMVKETFGRSYPFLIITAADAIAGMLHNGNPNPFEPSLNIRDTFSLLSYALDQLLIKTDDLDGLQVKSSIIKLKVREIRKAVLHTLVSRWPVSTRPIRVTGDQLLLYFQEAINRLDAPAINDSQTVDSLFQRVNPAGICLEQTYEGELDTYCFVHDKYQEFVYSDFLLKSLRDGNPTPFQKEYYSEGILELLGEAVDEPEIKVLLQWSMDENMDNMVRKVAASALGFIKDPDIKLRVVGYLKLVFGKISDIGVAGRIAESMRRLGDDDALVRFVENLDSYPERTEESGNPWRPLTFELDVQLPESLSRILEETLLEKLRNSKNHTRKHALICMLRFGKKPQRSDIVAYCVRQAHALLSAASVSSQQPNQKNVNASIRCLLYGIEGLARLGDDRDIRVLMEIRDYLIEAGTTLALRPLVGRISEGLLRLKNRPWYSPTDTTPAVLLVRHAESISNKTETFAGRASDPELSDRGRLQALATAEACEAALLFYQRSLVRIVSSPAKRCTQTTKVIADRLNLEFSLDDRLFELDMGLWSGRPKSSVALDWSGDFECWLSNKWLYAPPNGETLGELKARVFEALRCCLKTQVHRAAVIVVTHLHPIVVIHDELSKAAAADNRPENCSVSWYEWIDGQWVPRLLNDTKHLLNVGSSSPGYV